MKHNQNYRFWRSAGQCLLSGIALAVLTFVCFRLQVNLTTVALLYLIVIVLVSLTGGFVSSTLVSIIALICLDYFFTLPLFSLPMSKPLDVVALIAFLTTAFVINYLIAKVHRSFQEIQALKDQFRLVIDTTPAMVHSGLPDGSLDYFNQRWLDYLGAALEEIKDWKWTSKIHPDDVDAFVENWRSSVRTGDSFEAEARVHRADGTYRWMLHRKEPLRDEPGNIIKWHGSSIDIHDRKRAEETLRRSEAYLAEAQRLSHTASFAYNPGRRKTLFWSEELFRIFGLDPQRGVPDYNETRRLVHPDDLDRVSGECLQGFRAKADFTQDYRLLLDDGTVKHLHVIWHPVLDKEGEVIECVGTVADVTERKSAEQALRRSEALLAEGQRISHTGSFGWNVTTDEHFWSDETFRIFEYDVSTKITLQLILERVHPEDIPLVQQVIARAADRKDFDLEYRLLLPSGSVKYVHVVAHAVSDESGNIEFIGAVLDVTERKQAEETLRRSQAELARVTWVMTMGELTASIAHEINQPLAAVVTNANACLRWLAAPIPNLDEAREAVARIARDGKRASDVIARIRALVEKSVTERAYLDVNEVIQEVVGWIQSELQKNGVVLRMELAARSPARFGRSGAVTTSHYESGDERHRSYEWGHGPITRLAHSVSST